MRNLTTKIILQIVVLCFSTISYCQTLHVENNGAIIEFNDSHVASDFGRREGSTRFHNGVDFSAAPGDNDLEYDILSLSSGRVRRLKLTGTYRLIVVDDGGSAFGYGHIFRNSGFAGDQLGNFHIYLSTEVGGEVIIYAPGNSTISYALTSRVDLTNISFSYNSVTYSVANGNLLNQVNAGDKIAPLGDSGGGDPLVDSFDAHIHLYRFIDNNLPARTGESFSQNNDNVRDPLYYINNHTSPGFDVSLEIKNTGTFSGGSYAINPSFRVRADFQAWTGNAAGASNEVYQSATNDLNQVTIKIKPFYTSTYEVIQGAYFEAKISEGSSPLSGGNARYPSDGSPFNNTGTGHVDIEHYKDIASNSAGFGNYEKTGIVGASYSGGLPAYVNANYNPNPLLGAWDDYFFNDFPTRINRDDNYGRGNVDLASEVSETRYPDGEYQVLAEVENIFGTTWQSANGVPQELIIDNFRPYLDKVTIFKNDASGAVIYNGWYDEASFSHEGGDWNEASGASLFVKVEFSEPMKPETVKARLNSETIYVDQDGTYSVDQKEFYFTLPPIKPSEVGFQQTLVVSGSDLNKNLKIGKEEKSNLLR